MADKDEKNKAKKSDKKPDKAARPEGSGQTEKPVKADKAAKAEKAKTAKPEKGDQPAAPREPEPKVPARLKVTFEEVIRARLVEQFGYKNRMQIPVLDKVVINMGIGEGVADRKKVEIGRRRSRAYFRTEADSDQSAQIDRDLQAARRAGDRLQSYAAQGAHV